MENNSKEQRIGIFLILQEDSLATFIAIPSSAFHFQITDSRVVMEGKCQTTNQIQTSNSSISGWGQSVFRLLFV